MRFLRRRAARRRPGSTATSCCRIPAARHPPLLRPGALPGRGHRPARRTRWTRCGEHASTVSSRISRACARHVRGHHSRRYPLTFTYAGQAEAPQGKADVLDAKGPEQPHASLLHQQRDASADHGDAGRRPHRRDAAAARRTRTRWTRTRRTRSTRRDSAARWSRGPTRTARRHAAASRRNTAAERRAAAGRSAIATRRRATATGRRTTAGHRTAAGLRTTAGGRTTAGNRAAISRRATRRGRFSGRPRNAGRAATAGRDATTSARAAALLRGLPRRRRDAAPLPAAPRSRRRHHRRDHVRSLTGSTRRSIRRSSKSENDGRAIP